MIGRKLVVRCIGIAAIEYIAYEVIAAVGEKIKTEAKENFKKKEKGDTIIFKQNGKEYEVVL